MFTPSPQPGKVVGDKKRAVVFHPLATYSFGNYLAYVLYAPLYIAGPIITFNDFMWQVSMHHSRCLLFPVLIFLSPARTPGGYRAAGDGAICTALSNLATYDGDAHPCHARRRDQGCPRVEWHDPCAVIHSWFLEPYFCLAKGTLYNH